MSAAIAVQLRKEARALAPWWVVALIAVAAIAWMSNQQAGFPPFRRDLLLWTAFASGVSALVLGAIAFGHEFTSGTMPALMAQPVSRLRVLTIKLIPLAIAVVSVAALTVSLLDVPIRFVAEVRALVWGPVAVSVGLVPALTLITRRPLAGAVFGVAIPGALFVAARIAIELNAGGRAAVDLSPSLAWATVGAAATGGLALLVVAFQRLEITGGSWARTTAAARAATIAPSSADRPAMRAHWVSHQFRKELRLQSMTFAVSALYVAACVGVAISRRLDPDYTGPTFYGLTALHGVFVALLAGATVGAEERQLGTWAPQILQPVSFWRPWALKAGLATGLAMALSVGLPALLMWLDPPPDRFRIETEFVFAMGLLTSLAIFISSLSRSTLWALLACFPVLGAVSLVAQFIDPVVRSLGSRARYEWFESMVTPAMRLDVQDPGWRTVRESMTSVRIVEEFAAATLLIGVGLFTLYVAGRNFRSLDLGASRIARQSLALVTCAAFAAVAYVGVSWLARIVLA
jgi:hypothetical protein